MRNPALALKPLAVLQEAGNDIARRWSNLVVDFSEALDAARSYGTERCQLNEKVWRNGTTDWEGR